MKVSEILQHGQRFERVTNTYRPELDGTIWHCSHAGSGVLDSTDDMLTMVSHTTKLAFRDNGDGTYTSRLVARPGHTLTIRPIPRTEV